MAKPPSNRGGVRAALARIVKWVMVAVLIPVAIGLFQGTLQQLETLSGSGALYRTWVERGFLTYVWLHLLLYRPVALFRSSHRVFSVLAMWLFGGQVASVEQTYAPPPGRVEARSTETLTVALRPFAELALREAEQIARSCSGLEQKRRRIGEMFALAGL